jgi:hypothetical protein
MSALDASMAAGETARPTEEVRQRRAVAALK